MTLSNPSWKTRALPRAIWRLPLFLRNMRYVMHLGLTGILAWWAVILAWPIETFPTSKSYTEFARICSDENYWAFGFGVTVLIAIGGCWAAWPWRKPQRWHDALRVSSALLLGVNHGIIALLFARSNPATTATGAYVIIMLMAYLLAASEVDSLD